MELWSNIGPQSRNMYSQNPGRGQQPPVESALLGRFEFLPANCGTATTPRDDWHTRQLKTLIGELAESLKYTGNDLTDHTLVNPDRHILEAKIYFGGKEDQGESSPHPRPNPNPEPR